MHVDTATRQRWMRVLAHSQPAALRDRMNALSLTPDYDTIRAPEIGLVQIQARMGGTGQRFLRETPPHPRRDPPEQRHAGLQLRAGTR